MVKRRDDLVELVFDAIKEGEGEWRRAHLGASGIGAPCKRKTWLSYRWAVKPDFPARILALFDRGNREEEAFESKINAVTGMGITGQQTSYSRCHGHFGGSIDGGIELDDDGWYLAEFKTYNTSRFKALVKNGVERSDPVYYTQLQAYMGFSGLARSLFWAVAKETDDLYCEEVAFSSFEFSESVEVAEELVYKKTPPARISGNPSYYLCKMCNFYGVCHQGEVSKIEENCRTCSSGAPSTIQHGIESAGKWWCSSKLKILNLEEQKQGCANHELRDLGVCI